MKKQLKFFVSFAVVAMLGMMVSCDPAEGAYTEERYVDNIYTANHKLEIGTLGKTGVFDTDILTVLPNPHWL